MDFAISKDAMVEEFMLKEPALEKFIIIRHDDGAPSWMSHPRQDTQTTFKRWDQTSYGNSMVEIQPEA